MFPEKSLDQTWLRKEAAAGEGAAEILGGGRAVSSGSSGRQQGEDVGGEFSALTTTTGVSRGPGHGSGQRGHYTHGSEPKQLLGTASEGYLCWHHA